jgi:hypothetical protein
MDCDYALDCPSGKNETPSSFPPIREQSKNESGPAKQRMKTAENAHPWVRRLLDEEKVGVRDEREKTIH